MPYPLEPPLLEPRLGRADVGFDDRFTFLFAFDFYSSALRKNPHGLIQAFRLAFDDGEGPALVVKTINGRKPAVSGDLEELRWAARGRSDIVVIDRRIEPHAVQSMIAACDCYVSLHRAEGLGFTISDAMAAGRPVIATAFGGNLDFMTDENSYLVQRRGFAPVGPAPYRAYPEESIWAEPDVEHAASLLREVYEAQEVAAGKGAAAAADLAARFSAEETGARMRDRLEAIRTHRAVTPRVVPPVVRAAWGDRR